MLHPSALCDGSMHTWRFKQSPSGSASEGDRAAGRLPRPAAAAAAALCAADPDELDDRRRRRLPTSQAREAHPTRLETLNMALYMPQVLVDTQISALSALADRLSFSPSCSLRRRASSSPSIIPS